MASAASRQYLVNTELWQACRFLDRAWATQWAERVRAAVLRASTRGREHDGTAEARIVHPGRSPSTSGCVAAPPRWARQARHKGWSTKEETKVRAALRFLHLTVPVAIAAGDGCRLTRAGGGAASASAPTRRRVARCVNKRLRRTRETGAIHHDV